MASFKVLACLLVLHVVAGGHFDNYRLIRISPKTEEQKKVIEPWTQNADFDVFNMRSDSLTVLLSPKAYSVYGPILARYQIDYDIINHNYQKVVDEESESIRKLNLQRILKADSSLVGTFASYASITTWLDQLAAENTFVSTYSTGKTVENRDLKVIKIKTPTTKKAIWIDCGIHAREWISPSTCVWIIDAFIKQYNAGNATVKKILDYYEVHVLPVHNPDGYEFSRSSTANRLWRKNRNRNTGSTCIGVDLNRNFGYQWMVAGASNNPCAETYAGPTKDSELETQGVQSAINALRGKWDAFFTIHTYGQYWFTPWGYTSALPSDYTELASKSQIGANAIRAVYGSVFSVGSSTNLLYAAAGGSDDWAKAVAGVKYSHCLELRPKDTGVDASYGFQLPVDRAPKAGEETYAGILAFLNAIYGLQP